MISTYIITCKQTLYSYLKSRNVSDKVINNLISKNAVKRQNEDINSQTILNINDKITIDYSCIETNKLQEAIDKKINVLFENTEVICLDKDEEILIHQDGNNSDNLLGRVVCYLRKNGDDSYIRTIHRIDVKTMGVVVFAKNIISYQEITRQLESNDVYRLYEAVVKGIIKSEMILEYNIGRNRHESGKYIVTKNGKKTYTKVVPKKIVNGNTFTNIEIRTGRTHQIRVSLAHAYHYVIGDDLYGNKDKVGNNNKLMLISKEFGFLLDGTNYLIKSKQTLI